MEVIDFAALLNEQYAVLRGEVESEEGKSPKRGNSGDCYKESQSTESLLEKNASNNIGTQTSRTLSRNDYSYKGGAESANELISKGSSDRFSPEMTKPELANSGYRSNNTIQSTENFESDICRDTPQILPEVPYFDNKYGTSVSKNTPNVHLNTEMQMHARTDTHVHNKLCSGGVSGKFSLEMTKPELGNSGFRNNTNQNTVHSECDIGRNSPLILPEVPYFNNNYGTSMSNTRFIKFIPSDTSDWLQEKHPNAFLLLCQIAKRARRFNGHIDGLEIGMAHIGDYHTAGIETEKKYRTAKDVLIRIGAIKIIETARKRKKRATETTTRTATVGTLVTLLKSDIWDINPEVEGDRNVDTKGDRRATEGRPKGDEQEVKESKEVEEYKGNLYSTMSNEFSSESTDSVDSSYSQARPTRLERIFFNWETGKLEGIEQSDLDGWQQAFPHVNVLEHLKFIEQDIGHKKTKYGRRKRIIQTVLVYLKNQNENQIAYKQRVKSNPYHQKKPQPQFNKDTAPRNPKRTISFVDGAAVIPEGFLED